MISNEVLEQFNALYSDYVFPFEDADAKLDKLDKEERLMYLQEAQRFVNSKCYKNEMESIVRRFYKELATKACTEEELTAYRRMLIFIKAFETRLNYLSGILQVEKNFESQYNKVK